MWSYYYNRLLSSNDVDEIEDIMANAYVATRAGALDMSDFEKLKIIGLNNITRLFKNRYRQEELQREFYNCFYGKDSKLYFGGKKI